MKTQNKGFSLNWRIALKRLRIGLTVAQSTLLRLGLPSGHHKVFAIGFNKTATTSIHKVFQKLGLLSLHNVSWRDTSKTLVFLKYQCFTDGPPDDFAKLDRRFKHSKFILNIRDQDEWIDSRLEHIRLTKERKKTKTSPIWDRTDFAVKHWILERNRYHLQVLDYFRDRPEDLLVLNYIREPDPGRKIADFLGKSKNVDKIYQRSTKKTRDAGALRNQARIHRCFLDLGVPESTWKADIHCPTNTNDTTRWPYDSSNLNNPEILTPSNESEPAKG